MPGPFPGMDPFLESPARWSVLHTRLVPYLADTINPLLPERYVANPTERVYVVVEIREPFIEIVSVEQPGRVIATIEILSPYNKLGEQTGRELYRKKQDELLNSSAHLMEIDLLRQGQHTIAAPRHALERFSPWHYMVCLHRAGAGRRFEVWPVRLQDRLPRVYVPLDEGDEPVVVDLQVVLDHCYDAGAFGRQIDYRGSVPGPALEPGEAEWANALLRAKGLRTQ
ncbi:MAG TPA: DUF4058 family protein [Planctomycetaceae bacterium]|nr:DUF4058 family protein [Planctomycetaceae bacterium]